ncbi:hypothetical protein DL771_009192 [Monosporascus sp. 5C6A]|nr:hypothetical protein DL771_009192 [Monosporascus sp. 5C6A]
MFDFKNSTAFQGSGYIVLNGIRAINIFILTATAASCFLMMIFAKMPNAFQFFTDINLFFIVCICILLIWTELPFGRWKEWINKTWPVFSPGHGFTWLGLAMFLMGCHTLGALTNEPYTKKTIGVPVWRIVAASGCLAIAFGTINMLASLLYSNRAEGFSAREVRGKGATTIADKFHYGDSYSQRSNSVRQEKTKSMWRFTKNFKPSISRPIANDVERDADAYPAVAEDRSSPIIPHVQRPPTALHPAIHGGHRSSIYSEASHLHRFDENKI